MCPPNIAARSLARLAPLAVLAALVIPPSAAHAELPPPERLELRITPNDRNAQRGDVLDFLVEAINTSDISLLRDGESGGVALQLSLPEGLGYVPGSGRIELSSGQVVKALDPAVSRPEPRLVQDRDGNPEPLNLAARQGLRFRFQLRVLPKAEPYRQGTLAARLMSADGTPLSPEAKATLQVEADPELDLAAVLGVVFCDHDGDGHRDPGEPGAGGIRIAADTGRVVDTDAHGRFHLRDFRPGAHLLKLDAHTLVPPAKPTTPTTRLLDLTGGLLAQTEFGVTCHGTALRTTELILAGHDEAAPIPTSPVLMVRGDTRALSLSWEGYTSPARRALLHLEGDAMTPGARRERVRSANLPWRPQAFARPLKLLPAIDGLSYSPEYATWQIEIRATESHELVHLFEGRGLPPAELSWDGLDAEGVANTLQRGHLYALRLIVVDGEGERLESAPVMLGASWSAAGIKAEYSREVARDGLFTSTQEPTQKLIALLRRARLNLDKLPNSRLLIEVHVGPSGLVENDLVETRRAAFNIEAYARRELGLTPDSLLTVGLGATRPLRPNVTDRNKALNRRVEIVILPPEDLRALAAPPLPTFPPRAFVQGAEVAVTDGLFTHPVPRADAMAFSLESADGARRTLVLGLVKPPPKPEGVDAQGALTVPSTPATSPPPPTAPTPPAPSPLANDPLRHFGGAALRDALGEGALVTGGERGPTRVTADDLEVTLPEAGTVLASPRLFVRGRAHPKNTVTIAGQPVRLDEAGRFAELITVPSDMTALIVESRDPKGHLARLSHPLTVAPSEVFLLALVDGVGGQLGARLEELASYDRLDSGSLFLAGRGALYAKARVSGTALAKDLFLTAHLDSTRKPEFSAFYDQVIDPTRDYVIYGDASDDLRDANARGRFYVMVEADKSKLGYGSFRTDIRGVHLLRYDRTFDGAHIEVDRELADGFRTRVRGHLSDDNRRLVRRHDELRATGGSLYYLSSRDIIEGSDKVELVVRELDTGLELGRTTLTRDVHYRVDYPSGRVMMSGPIASVVEPFMQIGGFQPFTDRGILEGHAVWLDVDYESRAKSTSGDLAWGVHARQELFGTLELGGGYLREGRPAGASGGSEDYVLWGLHAKLKLSENSQIFGEYAKNTDKDGATRVSTDGGLDYDDLDRAPDDNRGDALALGLDLRLGEVLNIKNLDLQVKGHWRYVDAGYHAVGLASEEATERWGGEVVWKPYEAGRVQVRYDGGTTLTEDPAFESGLRGLVRNRILGRYDHDFGFADTFVEAAFGEHRDDLDGKVHHGTAAATGASLDLGRVRLHASQEAIFGGDDAILGATMNDRLTTHLGLDLSLTDDLALTVGESIRWNGDNATRLGFSTRLPNGGRAYLEERIKPGDRNGRVVGSTVLGAEHALGRDGRVYTEYRLDGGVGGRTNRAVMGLGRSLELSRDVKVMLAYERSQVFDTPEVLARGSRDVLSGGLEVKRDVINFSGLYEVRWDRDLPPTSEYTQILQAWARNSLDLRLGDEFTVLALFNYGLSQDLDSRTVAREDLEATVGLAYRPDEDLTLIARYSRLLERRASSTVSLLGERLDLDDTQSRDLLSLTAIIALPLDMELTEKLVWRFHAVDAGLENSSDLLLWLNRLAFPIWSELELASELRLLASLTDLDFLKAGGLFELSFTLLEHARIGLGWALDANAGGLLPGEEETDLEQGFFVRLTGMY
jgi:hypothetical protein